MKLGKSLGFNAQELLVPLVFFGLLGSILFPLPAMLLDLFLVANLALSIMLLVSALHIKDPLKLSVLPTLLLIGTVFRLCLNISTTRLILSGQPVGDTINAFGQLVISGNLAVGIVLFLVITLVQFIVIAKGSERVAEVSARFTLDALPGKQMAIDADMRAGMFDYETARKRRAELQSESRFYGALDGAMKFVKGDAIASIIIVIVNCAGGFCAGVFLKELEFSVALQQYTLLSIGEGLLAQIPSLLNSLAAGFVVTRVGASDEISLSEDLVTQLSQSKFVYLVTGGCCLLMAFFPLMPTLPLLTVAGSAIFYALRAHRTEKTPTTPKELNFAPRKHALLTLSIPRSYIKEHFHAFSWETIGEQLKQDLFDLTGVIIVIPQLFLTEFEDAQLLCRGIPVKTLCSVGSVTPDELYRECRAALEELLPELIDDQSTRTLTDLFELDYPELVNTVLPQLASITQLTEIVKALIAEGVSVKNLDLILQCIAESATKSPNERHLLQEIRIRLGREICSCIFSPDLKAYPIIELDPLIDLSFSEAENGKGEIIIGHLTELVEQLKNFESEGPIALLCSRRSRRLIRECLIIRKIKIPVIAFEEIPAGAAVKTVHSIKLNDTAVEQWMGMTKRAA